MKILALEPYYGGSHRAFLDGWVCRSRHEWTLLTLPPYFWKWRMRHAPVAFAADLAGRTGRGEKWDALFCSDMLSLADFMGLAPPAVRTLPALIYFHENQLTYPVTVEKDYDYHFAFANMTSALAANRVWFNSRYHQESFLAALDSFLRRMPDHQPLESVEAIRVKSSVRYPGIDAVMPSRGATDGPLHILWAARWEPDKNPGVFFDALDTLNQAGIAFQLSVIGGRETKEALSCFREARERFSREIVNWGFLESRQAYLATLASADVIVSTADHEFFGIGIVEAVTAGAYPLVPRRLAYPEVLAGFDEPGKDSCFYNAGELAERLMALSGRHARGDLWQGDAERGVRAVHAYRWEQFVGGWDDEISSLAAPR